MPEKKLKVYCEANPVALPKTVSTISKAGYECPVIITPMDFLDRKEEFGL